MIKVGRALPPANLVLLLLAALPAAAQADTPYYVAAAKNVMVAMRDGVKLATDIYRPPQRRAGRRQISGHPGAHAVQQGSQRGRGELLRAARIRCRPRMCAAATSRKDTGSHPRRSERRIRHCQMDRSAALVRRQHRHHRDFLRRRDAACSAIANAPYVKAMIPVTRCRTSAGTASATTARSSCAGSTGCSRWVTPPERPTPRRGRGACGVDPAAAAALARVGNARPRYVRGLPLRPGTTPLKFAPDYEAWLIEAMSHGDYDDFWKDSRRRAWSTTWPNTRTFRMYHVTGWYDSWGTPVANLNYVELRKTKKSLQRLIIGPWTHGGRAHSYAGEAQFTDDAALDFKRLQSALVRSLAEGRSTTAWIGNRPFGST